MQKNLRPRAILERRIWSPYGAKGVGFDDSDEESDDDDYDTEPLRLYLSANLQQLVVYQTQLTGHFMTNMDDNNWFAICIARQERDITCMAKAISLAKGVVGQR